MLGESVRLVSIDQTREGLSDANSVFEEISGGTDEVSEIACERVGERESERESE